MHRKTAESVSVHLVDISRTGLRFRSPATFAPDSVIQVEIDYSPLNLVMHAIVVWCDEGPVESSHGVEFIDLSPPVRVMLEDHLDSLRASLSHG